MIKQLTLSTFILGIGVSTIFAKEPRTPEMIFVKKCAMCHTVGKPQNAAQRSQMVAPPIDVAMAGVVITIDAVDGPFKDDELRTESITFLKDYLYNPTEDKTNCEDHVVKRFGRMPSLKGFISSDELDRVVPWVYDTYKPQRINGSYVKPQL
jgi:hypothetical protein